MNAFYDIARVQMAVFCNFSKSQQINSIHDDQTLHNVLHKDISHVICRLQKAAAFAIFLVANDQDGKNFNKSRLGGGSQMIGDL